MLDQPSLPISRDDLRIVIVVSQYHAEITASLTEGAKEAFINAGGNEQQLTIVPVPGAWELPVVAAAIAEETEVDAIVALGCIVAGETSHDQVIAQAIAGGLMELSIRWGKPVAMGLLTCNTMEQAQARAGGDCGNKGIEAMNAALCTITTISK